jgi:hypothetical protein
MHSLRLTLLSLFVVHAVLPASPAQTATAKVDLTQPQDYVLKRVSSFDRSGGNADYRKIAAGQTLAVLDVDGPATLTHIWITLSSPESYHLKKLVLRMYWDHETSPSVETPLGDFFGLGLGDYYVWESELLSVAHERAELVSSPCRFKNTPITLTNEGREAVDAFYFNLDYRAQSHPLPQGTLYFHAQFRQAQPNHGWTNDWKNNGDPRQRRKNSDGKDNYVWMEAAGQGRYVGVTMSILKTKTAGGAKATTCSSSTAIRIHQSRERARRLFLGAYDFGEHSFSYRLFGAPVKGEELAGRRSSVYRFHIDSPVTFTKSLRATIEHGHANHRSDNFYSVAYWYQTEPHAQFPALPPVDQRVPRLQPVGGPGNAAQTR